MQLYLNMLIYNSTFRLNGESSSMFMSIYRDAQHLEIRMATDQGRVHRPLNMVARAWAAHSTLIILVEMNQIW